MCMDSTADEPVGLEHEVFQIVVKNSDRDNCVVNKCSGNQS